MKDKEPKLEDVKTPHTLGGAQGSPINLTYAIHLLQMLEEALKVSLFADRVE